MTDPKSNIFNPFPGLRPFNQEEDYLFFGREQQVAELVTLLRKQRFLAVTGTSGSGKSSLVRAGLLPELQGGMMKEVGSDWETLVLRPGGAPLQHLAEAVAEASLEDPEDPKVIGELLATLNHSGLGLVEAIRQSEIEPGTNVLVLIDQFEEIFRFQRSGATNEEQAVSFVNLLLEAGAQRDVPIFVIITMRSDYLGDCTEFRGLTEAVNEGEYLIPRLTRDQIRSCIEGPIKVGGGQISFSLVQELLNSLGSEQDQLPVLQHALMRTFDHWRSDESAGEALELNHYLDVGGMEEALSRHADEVFAGLDEPHQHVAEAVFKAITERGVDNRGIRRPTRLDLLTQIAGAELDQVVTVVEAFRHPGVTFLMPPSDVPLTPETVIDISHESLMRVWRRLEDWVDTEAQSARIYRRLSETAELHRQGKAGLYRDPDLQIALAWRDATSPTSNWAVRYAPGFDQAMSFLEQSEESAHEAERELEAARQRELEQAQALAAAEAQRATLQQRAARRLRILSTGVAAVAVVALIAFVFALVAQKESKRQRALAEKNAIAAEASKLQAEENAEKAVRLQTLAQQAKEDAVHAAVELNDTLTRSQFVTAHEQIAGGKNDLALAYLARSLRTEPSYWQAAAQILSLLSEQNFPIEKTRTIEQEKPFRYWGADEERRVIWTLGDALNGSLWNARSGEKIAPMNEGNQVDWPTFTENGKRIYVALPGEGGSIVGLNTETGLQDTPIMRVSNRFNKPYGVLSKIEGQERVLLDDPQTRQLMFWDAVSGKPIELPRQSKAPLNAGGYSWSPDHRYVTAIFADKTCSVWSAKDGKPLATDVSHGMAVSDMGMSPDSKWLFLSSRIEQSIALARVRPIESADANEALASDGLDFQKLTFDFPVRKVAFHPEKPLLVVAGRTVEQGMLRVIDLETAEVVTSITQDEFGVQSKESLAGFRFLGFEESEDLLRRWIVGVVSHEGHQLRVFDLESGGEIHRFDFDDSPVNLAEFTADGGRLVTVHEDSTLRIWDVFSGTLVTAPIEHPFQPSFKITKDGEKVVTFNVGDMSVRVFSTRTGETLMLPLRASRGGFASGFMQLQDRAEFVSREMTSLSVSGVQRLHIGLLNRWSARPRSARKLPMQFDGVVYRASFSPDSSQVVAGGDARDTKVKIWNVNNSHVTRAFRHGSGVNNSTFSPDGSKIVTGSNDGVVRIWNLEKEGELDLQIDVGGNPAFVQFNKDGSRLLIRTLEGAVGVWDAASGFPLFEPLALDGDCCFSVDGKLVVLGGSDGLVRLIDSETGDVSRLGTRHNSRISLSVSPGGQHIVTSAFADSLKVWDLSTGELAWTTENPGSYLATAFHPNGDIVAACNAMNSDWDVGQIDVWNWRTGKRPVEALDCEGQIYAGALEFSPDGRFIAAGTVDGLLLIWEVSTGKQLYRTKQHSGKIWTVSFSADSKRLLTCSGDGTVKVFDLPPVHDPIPVWLPELAELVAKRRINESGAVEVIDGTGLEELKKRISDAADDSGFTRWAKWFLSDPNKRPAASAVELPTPEYIDALARSEDLQDQYEAFLLDPNNGLISCRIGYLLAVSPRRTAMEAHERTHWDAAALWYCRQGVELSPDMGEAWALQAAVEQVVGKPAEESIAKALKLDPKAPIALFAKAYELHDQGKGDEAYEAFAASLGSLPENRHVLDWENEKPFLIGTLRRILAKSERNAQTLAQSGLGRLLETGDTQERRSVEAEWLTRYACELAPEDVQVWRLRSQILTSLGRESEAEEALQKSLEFNPDGTPDWQQVGRILTLRSDELVQLKEFTAAHEYLLENGIPERSKDATDDQVDLTSFYNQTLIEMPYRSKADGNNSAKTWKRLPIGLVDFNGVTFDVRGMIRLSGGFVVNREFPQPLPSNVSDIKVNRKTDYLHFLHNVVAGTGTRIADGEPVGYYEINYVDGEKERLPILYGQDVVHWMFNQFVAPREAAIGWSEGHYSGFKTLSQSCWENPRPDVEIKTVTFGSANNQPAPFLVALTVGSTEPEKTDDALQLSSGAYRKAVFTKGQTSLTHESIDTKSRRAMELRPDDPIVIYRRAEVLHTVGKQEDALKLVSELKEESPDHPGYRLLEARILWEMERFDEAAEALHFPVSDFALSEALSDVEQVLLERLRVAAIDKLGAEQGREWFVKSMIAPRPADYSPLLVDLTDHYNAIFDESWYTPRNSPNIYGKVLNTLRPGKHVLNGTPFDIRGIIQLNNREVLEMVNTFPLNVEQIKVGVAGDQIHFLHSAIDEVNVGAPVAVYRIQLADGTVHQHGVRWDREIKDFITDRNTESPAYAAWRAEGVTQYAGVSDAVLYQSTWTNPTPEVKISTVDFLSVDSRSQPFLVAMSVESFSEDLKSDPADAKQFAQLALRKLTGGTEINDRVVKQVRSLIKKAMNDAPQDPDVWRAAAEISLRLDEMDSAMAAIDKSLKLNPVSSDSWQLKGSILGKVRRFDEARAAQKKKRSAKVQELIKPRDPATDPRFVDLSGHYNVGLQEFPYQALRPERTLTETFSNIKPGLNTFGEVEFDVRGLVALEGKETELAAGQAELERRVTGIQVGQTAKAIHLLHGAGWGSTDPHGTCIGKFVVNYEDGGSQTIEINSGEHVRDWFLSNISKRQVSGGKLVWVNPSKEVPGRDIGLYTLRWQNPQPDRKIASFDYESTMNYGAPFLLGVTLEN